MVKLKDYRKPAFAIDAAFLDFALDPDHTIVSSKLAMRRLVEGEPLLLNGRNISLRAIAVDGVALDASAYEITPDALILRQPLPAQFTLEIETATAPAVNTALEGLYMSGGRFCTQCEAESFRWITYFLDRPDVLTRYTVRVAAEKARFPTLLCNGDKIEEGDLDDGRHYAVFNDPHLKPAYLFALVAGEFDSIEDKFVTRSGRVVKLAIHVDPGDAPRAAYAMEVLKNAMAWDEERFLREYDLGEFHIVAVRDFNYGAMENKGLNVFNSSLLLADYETSTDADFFGVMRVIAHEYFHNWTGNRITLRDWFQLCLKEGLTVYRDQEFTADMGSRPVQRILDVMRLREEQLPEDNGPLAHAPRPTEYQSIENFYTPTVYRKGAEVVRVLRAMIGAEAFDRGIQLYFERCDGMAATLEDFLACFEESSGRDLKQFFRWYEQIGTPTLTVESEYDAANQRLTIDARQTTQPTPGQPEKLPVPIPMRVGLISETGAPLTSRFNEDNIDREEHDLVLEDTRMRFTLEGVESRPIPAVLRGFQAPVMLRQNLAARDRLIQMTYDPDGFTRWEAGRTLMSEAIVRPGSAEVDVADLVGALTQELRRQHEDPAFVALALQTPSLSSLVHAKTPADPEALHRARENLMATIAGALEPQLQAIAAAPAPAATDIGPRGRAQRSLRGVAFELLARLGRRHEALLSQVFASAQGMTEKLNALRALSAIDGPAYRQALDAFLEAHRRQPLVVDKWFAVQAAAPSDDAVERVRALAQHDLFTLQNPNRARALYATFGNTNLRAFNAADGSGYRLLAEAMLAVDKLNPMVASRFARAFDVAPLMDAARWRLAQSVVREALDSGPLSVNTTEILSKIIGHGGEPAVGASGAVA